MSETIRRDFRVTLTRSGPDERTLGGCCVPYGRPTTVSDDGVTSYREMFVRGSIDPKQIAEAHRVELKYRHGGTILDRIGRATQFEDRDDGLWGMFFVRDGILGDQALSLVDDGFLNGLSVSGVVKRTTRNTAGVVVRERVHLDEVSLCEQPAYAEALVSMRRSRVELAQPNRPSDEQLARLAKVGIRLGGAR